MRHVITAVLLAGALSMGGVACSEETETSWEQAGHSTGRAVEQTGHDVRRDTGAAMRQAGRTLKREGEELRDHDPPEKPER